MVCSFLLGVEMQASHADAKNPARLSRPGECLENACLYQKSVTVASGFGHEAVAAMTRHARIKAEESTQQSSHRPPTILADRVGIVIGGAWSPPRAGSGRHILIRRASP